MLKLSRIRQGTHSIRRSIRCAEPLIYEKSIDSERTFSTTNTPARALSGDCAAPSDMPVTAEQLRLMSIIITQRCTLRMYEIFSWGCTKRAQSCVRSSCVYMSGVYVCVCVFFFFLFRFVDVSHFDGAVGSRTRAASRRRVYTLTTPVGAQKFAQCKYWLAA